MILRMNKKVICGRVFALLLTFMMVVCNFSAVTASNLDPALLQEQIDRLTKELATLEAEKSNAVIKNEQLENQIKELQKQLNETKEVIAPKLMMTSSTMITTANKSTASFPITIKNIGTGAASGVIIQAIAPADAPFTAEFEKKENISKINESASVSLNLVITTQEKIKSGTYSVTLQYSYKDANKTNVVNTDTLLVRIDSSYIEPKEEEEPEEKVLQAHLSFSDFNVSKKEINQNDSFTITAVLDNYGEGAAENVQITIDGQSSDTIFLSDSVSLGYYLEFGVNKPVSLSYSFKTGAKAATGIYPITFKVSYTDESKTQKSNSFVYYVNITNTEIEEEKPDFQALLTLGNLTEPSGVYKPGQDFTISFDLSNIGDNKASNIKVSAIASDPSALAPKTSNVQGIITLGIGETKKMTFKFSPTDKSASQSYNIQFLVEYETNSTKSELVTKSSFEQYVGVNVNNPEVKKEEEEPNQKISKPKVIIYSYEVDPIIVKAGQQFDLNLKFQNTHKDKTIQNIKVTLTPNETTAAKGSVFQPVDCSNTFYIDEIAPKGIESFSMRMYTVPDADPRNYTISVDFAYEDEDRNEYNERESIGINVKQVVKLETSEMYLPNYMDLYMNQYMYFTIYNTGKVNLSNLKVSIEGEGLETSNATVYFGNITKGNTTYYDGYFTAQMAGDIQAKLVISYEDDSGEVYRDERPFMVTVSEPFYPENQGGDIGMPSDEKPGNEKSQNFFMKNLLWFGIGGGVLLLVILGVVLKLTVFRKKKDMDFDL